MPSTALMLGAGRNGVATWSASMSRRSNWTADARPLQAGRLYRLSAWVRVDHTGPTTPMPFLKCEFVGADPKADLGRANTEACDAAKAGRWQHLAGEFRTPDGTVRGWVALEPSLSIISV